MTTRDGSVEAPGMLNDTGVADQKALTQLWGNIPRRRAQLHGRHENVTWKQPSIEIVEYKIIHKTPNLRPIYR